MDGKGHLINLIPPHLQRGKPRPTNEKPLAQGHILLCRKSGKEPGYNSGFLTSCPQQPFKSRLDSD